MLSSAITICFLKYCLDQGLVVGSVTAAQEAVEFWAESLAAFGDVVLELGPGDVLAPKSQEVQDPNSSLRVSGLGLSA